MRRAPFAYLLAGDVSSRSGSLADPSCSCPIPLEGGIGFPGCRTALRPGSAVQALSAPDLLALEAHGDAHAAADAQGGEALLGVALLHLVEKRDQHPRAGSADGMADRDGAAV